MLQCYMACYDDRQAAGANVGPPQVAATMIIRGLPPVATEGSSDENQSWYSTV